MDKIVEQNVEGEDRSEKFRRLARKRMTRLLREMDLMENLSGANYLPSANEVEAIFKAINTKIGSMRSSYERALNRGQRTAVKSFDF